MYQWLDDDEQVLARLKRALQSDRQRTRIVEDAKGAYTWRTIDAELAELARDSVLANHLDPASMRDTAAALRTLTFETGALRIELGVTEEALLGQLVPREFGTVQIRTATGSAAPVPVDELGCFTIRPTPTGSFSLRCELADGRVVVTDWITL